MALIEVLTRCYKRPNMLGVNQASLDAQTDPDWVQTLLIDDVGRGIPWSHTNMAAYAPHLEGDYIWILDDDDECILPTLVAEVRRIVGREHPDVIMLKMDHGPMGVLPSRTWGVMPTEGDIGCSAYIVRRDVWQTHASSYTARYAGDFDFISAILASGARAHWHDVVASRIQRRSIGAPE